jgi:putative ABC transport system permease protein
MRALNVKLIRDVWSLRGQALAIAIVIAAGVATYVMSASTLAALSETRREYYEDYRFADVFASLKRAPDTLAARVRELDGVDRVQTRVVAAAQIDLPGFPDPITGRLVSVPDSGIAVLNAVHLKRGRMVEPGREDEVMVSEAFAEAHGLVPGDALSAVIKGRQRTLTIVGVALSPEYIYQIAPGRVLPDYRRYAVLWMAHRPLAAAFEMEEGFNDLTIGLARAARVEDVIAAVDDLLAPYGGIGAYAREDQISHKFLNEEFRQLRQTSTMFSIIFLGVTAFLLNVVLARLVSTQREQIAILKAFGYRNGQIAAHYLGLVLLVVVLGVALGIAGGAWLGRGLSDLYSDYYRFPFLRFGIAPSTIAIAGLVSAVAAVLGTLGSARAASSMPPAEAMRPATPESYGRASIERLGLARRLDQPTRMILRHVARRPLKSALTIAGIAMACGIMMIGTFFTDALDRMVEIQFGLAQREDIAVTFFEPVSRGATHELAALPGVRRVEPFRSVPVRLVSGHLSYRTSISAFAPNAVLHRTLDENNRPVEMPGAGLLLTDQLADILNVEVGSSLQIELLEGSRAVREAPVVAIVRQYIGIGAYASLETLNRLAREGDAISGAFLSVDREQLPAIYARLEERPSVAGIEESRARLANFHASIGEFLLTYMSFVVALSGAITFGIVYNSARIAFAERERELASLRVLGFTRGEVSYILLGELGLLTLLALPPGFLVGRMLSAWLVASLPHELFRIPLVLEPATYALAAAVVLGAAVLSSLLVRRRVDRLDLVAVLKTRE